LEQFQAYQNLLVALKLEEENVLLARENFNIALTKYRLGASTQLDLITAVQSLESSLNRLVQAKFNAKISEINLLQLSGNLIN
jgi:outer membrane protein TolC